MIKKRIGLIFASVCLIFTVLAFAILSSVPDLDLDKITNVTQSLTVYDKYSVEATVIDSGQNRERISLDKIPAQVINALIATEDVRFFQHNGIDIKRIFGALVADVKSGSLKQGASTLTQQLIKNSHLTSEKTFMRKASEAVLALQLERKFSKEQILEAYLNFVYFGRGAYGIQAAAVSYFDKNAADLTLDEGAMLIGVLKAPGKYAPHIDYDSAVDRRNTVLNQMKKYGFITESEYTQAKSASTVICEEKSYFDYGFYLDAVLEEGAELLNISVSDLMGGGYKIYTALDPELQASVQEIYQNSESFPDDSVQSAAVVVNADGGIEAMVGGRSHSAMRILNRADTRRQAGSTLKPLIVYAPALENGSATPLTLLDDYRKDFNGYSPSNFKDIYYGKVTLRDALKLSLNVPAVELFVKNGISYSSEFAKKAGIELHGDDIYPSLALGSMKEGVTPRELASAYTVFARGGTYSEEYLIKRITDSNGNTVYEHRSETVPVYSPSTAYLITDILCEAAKSANNPFSRFNVDIACKTGTVGYNKVGYSDAWSVAYTSTHSVAVWMGYDRTDNESYLDESVTGSTYPSKVASEIFEKIISLNGYSPFVKPDTVIKKAVDAYTLKRSGEIFLATDYTKPSQIVESYFDIANAPQTVSEYWLAPSLPQDISLTLNELREAEMTFTAQRPYVQYVIYKNNAPVKTLSGEAGERLKYVDSDHFSGDTYSVQAVHREVYVKNGLLSGKMSKEYKLH